MPLKSKHIVEEIDGVRCTIVEKGAEPARVEFLKKLLEPLYCLLAVNTTYIGE